MDAINRYIVDVNSVIRYSRAWWSCGGISWFRILMLFLPFFFFRITFCFYSCPTRARILTITLISHAIILISYAVFLVSYVFSSHSRGFSRISSVLFLRS